MAQPDETRHALQIASGWLAAITRQFKLDEKTTRITLTIDGERIETTLGQALDLADAALEPEVERV